MRDPDGHSERLSVTAALLTGLVVSSCRCAGEPSVVAAGPKLARGDSVVVERSAADFFQARVLAVEGEKLRVQTAEEGDPTVVASADAYRIPAVAVSWAPGDYAVCNVRRARWIGCRIVEVRGAELSAVDVSGEALSLARDRAIRPTALTRLNIERVFTEARERIEFRKAAARAGEPPRPLGWSPHASDRVLARQQSGWFSARVRDFSDGGIVVQWDGEPGRRWIRSTDLTLPPPYRNVLVPGQFALEQPPTPGQPWKPVKVREVSAEGVVVEDENGDLHEVVARDLVPLGAPRVGATDADAGAI